LAADPASPARHPILRAMLDSGAREKLDNSLLQKLVSDAVMQMDVLPDADKTTLFERLAVQGESNIALELALEDLAFADLAMPDLEGDSVSLNSCGLGAGLFNMISVIRDNYREKIHFLPLDMLAEQRVSASSLQQFPPSPALLNIISQLAGFAVEAYDKGLAGLSASGSEFPTYLNLRWAMELRCLKRIRKNPERFFVKGKNVGPTDAWFAWVYCRGANRNRQSRVELTG
jgi:hypothetical protein